MKVKCDIRNLDCANCAAKVENHLRKQPGVRSATIDFAALTLHIDADDLEAVQKEIQKVEPDVVISVRGDKKREDNENEPAGFNGQIITIAVAAVLFFVQLIFEKQLHDTPWSIAEYVVTFTAYLLSGWNVLAGAFRTLRKGRMFDEKVLMTIATVGAIAIHALSEAVGVMIFYKIGEFLQDLAVSRSRRSIRSLLEIRPDYANLKAENGLERVDPATVKPGDIIVVKAGEKIPLDGEILEGSSQINTAALTGESVPVSCTVGDTVMAGSINANGLLTIRVTKTFSESSISKILDLVENATAKKAKTEQFITRFAQWYTPGVVVLALAVAVLPPLFLDGQTFSTWVYRALVLLVISCPCALMVSIPLGYFGGIGGASRRGILVKGSNFLDVLASVKSVVFDKTGTLTEGVFLVQEVVQKNGYEASDILRFAAIAEAHSNHPIALSIVAAAKQNGSVGIGDVLDHQEIPGQGVIVQTASHRICVGNDALMHRENIEHNSCEAEGTVVFVAVDGAFAGYIRIGDTIKSDAQEAIENLRMEGVHTVVMLTGDNESSAKTVANTLGISDYRGGLLPEGKVKHFESICEENRHKGGIAFVGDGINDAPVLARADVGIAMGALGSDAAIETADVVLMTDHPSKVAEAICIGKRTRAIVWQNIVFALTVKAVFLTFGAFGLAGMWEAVFADMGTALIAVLNASRALKS